MDILIGIKEGVMAAYAVGHCVAVVVQIHAVAKALLRRHYLGKIIRN